MDNAWPKVSVIVATLLIIVAFFIYCYVNAVELKAEFNEKTVACVKELGKENTKLCHEIFQLPFKL
jgi:hypothetical protein